MAKILKNTEVKLGENTLDVTALRLGNNTSFDMTTGFEATPKMLRKIHENLVELNVIFYNRTGGNAKDIVIATLPLGYRPVQVIYTVAQYGGNSFIPIRINTNGTIYISGNMSNGSFIGVHILFAT